MPRDERPNRPETTSAAPPQQETFGGVPRRPKRQIQVLAQAQALAQPLVSRRFHHSRASSFPFSPPPGSKNSLAHGFPMAAGRAHSRLTSPTRRPIPKMSRRSSRSPQHHRDATISRLASRRSRDRLNSYLSSIRSPPTTGMCMPVRCTFVRYMPMRCTLVRCTPMRYTPMCTPIRYTLSPARCSRCAEFCMRGCKYLEWERGRKVFAGEMGEKMGEEWSQIREPWLVGGGRLSGPSLKVDDFW
jgi:hypothetical protein